MSKLYILMGTPASGKSTFVKTKMECPTDKWVSRDAIRFAMVSEQEEYFSREKDVFNEYIRRINNSLKNGFDVFADATHLNRASRNKLLRNLYVECDEVYVVWIKTPLEQCLENNEKRIGSRAYVPPTAIYKMYNSIESPELEEGFDKIYIIEPNKQIKVIERSISNG